MRPWERIIRAIRGGARPRCKLYARLQFSFLAGARSLESESKTFARLREAAFYARSPLSRPGIIMFISDYTDVNANTARVLRWSLAKDFRPLQPTAIPNLLFAWAIAHVPRTEPPSPSPGPTRKLMPLNISVIILTFMRVLRRFAPRKLWLRRDSVIFMQTSLHGEEEQRRGCRRRDRKSRFFLLHVDSGLIYRRCLWV